MNNTSFSRWKQFHAQPLTRSVFSPEIENSWKTSYTMGLDPNSSVPTLCSTAEFNKIKDDSLKIFTHAHYLLKKNMLSLESSEFGFALFSKDGCLLKLYGSEEFLKWTKLSNIEKGYIWSENTIGTNAVSLSLKNQHPVSVIGEEHFSKFGINISSHFAPISIEHNKGGEILYGGICIFGPTQSICTNLLTAVSSIAREISLMIYWFDSFTYFFDTINEFAHMVVDTQQNSCNVLTISQNTFKLLQQPYKDLDNRPLSELIDPLPKNKKFWDIIKNNTKVIDLFMTLSVSGVQIEVVFSTYPYFEKQFNIVSTAIRMSSKEKINSLISRHTGNNAKLSFDDIIGKNASFTDTLNHAQAAATCDGNVLLLGESGVGKDIIAQAMHNASPRKNKPFIVINCAAIPRNLIESELFGYDEGSFTGSKKGGNIGKFELAHGGTIFLDEIGDMPLDLQAVLLRVIEQKSFMRIGSNTYTNVDVRVIAATNARLDNKIQQKEFRQDLFYRLGVIRINIPPLRERKDDILLLANHFIKQVCTRISRPLATLSTEVNEIFVKYDWPGNVREIQNLIEGTMQIYSDDVVTSKHIRNYIDLDSNLSSDHSEVLNSKNRLDLTSPISEPNSLRLHSQMHYEKPIIEQALKDNKYNKTATAKQLNISRRTLYRRLKEYNLI